jgi:hypothetical protein
VSFVLPLIAVPVFSVALFIVSDIVRLLGGAGYDFQWIVLPEAILILPGTLIIVAAFAAIVGMQMSLRCRTTVMAVMSSVGIVVGICAALGACGFGTLDSATSEGALALAGFSPFTVIAMLVDPYMFAQRIFQGPMGYNLAAARSILLVFSWAATAAYAAVVWSMYRSMVKNFDMTIRKQSR